jgi:spermidine/putrescine transport system permease protein
VTPLGRRLLALHSALVLAFLWIPILVLVVFSFNAGRQTTLWEGASLDWYRRLLDNPRLLGALANSVWVGLATTTLATAVGTAAALALGRQPFARARVTRAALLVPLVLPEVVLGAALLNAFAAIEWRLGLATVVLAHVLFSVPYVVLVVGARLATLDPTLEAAARDLGASATAAFWRVTFPQLLPAIAAAALLVFTVSLDDYVVTSFVAGVGATTLPLFVYSLLKVNVTPEVNAISTLLLAVTTVAVLVAQRLAPPSLPGEPSR